MSLWRKLIGIQKTPQPGRVEYLKDICRRKMRGDLSVPSKSPTVKQAVSELQDYLDFKDVKAFVEELKRIEEGHE